MTTKQLRTINLIELAKRVPPNQREQFEAFFKKSLEYRRRVDTYPDKLRTIDWEYYRTNVRDKYVKVVGQFQRKYEELNHCFARRYETLDHTKYYTEWEQLNAKAEEEVKIFLEESRKRVESYKKEMERLKNFSYEDMTIEEFIELRPEMAHFIPGQGKPLFWPHTPEEQLGYGETINTSGKSEEKLGENLKEPKFK